MSRQWLECVKGWMKTFCRAGSTTALSKVKWFFYAIVVIRLEKKFTKGG
jgi:hypothetical protein